MAFIEMDFASGGSGSLKTYATLNLKTTEETLKGKAITITLDEDNTYFVSTTFGTTLDGGIYKASAKLQSIGNYTITCEDAEEKKEITDLTSSYDVELSLGIVLFNNGKFFNGADASGLTWFTGDISWGGVNSKQTIDSDNSLWLEYTKGTNEIGCGYWYIPLKIPYDIETGSYLEITPVTGHGIVDNVEIVQTESPAWTARTGIILSKATPGINEGYGGSNCVCGQNYLNATMSTAQDYASNTLYLWFGCTNTKQASFRIKSIKIKKS